MSIPKKLQAVIDKKKELQKEVEKVGKAGIKELLSEFFETWPTVKAL